MKIEYRVPAKVTGGKEEHHAAHVVNFYQVWVMWRRAKKAKARAFYIFF